MRKLHYLILVSLLVACSPRVDNRGHVNIESKLKNLSPNATQQEVLTLLGSPSTRSSFGKESWYYVSARKESTAFFKPEIADQKVTRITFNESGTIEKIDNYGLKDAKEVEVVEDITPTEGQQLGLWEQILGNFGRFNKPVGYTGPHSSTNRLPGQ